MKFKSDIEVQAGLKDSSGANGTAGQVLSSNGGTVSWVNGSTIANDVQNRVKAGVAINKGQAVYVTGADGTNVIVGLASNTSEATSSKTLGLLNATVAINGFADVVQIGKLSGLNTIGANVGDPVWLGTNGNLIYGLANKPYAPAHLVYIGVVTRVNANNGEIFVTVQNGFELKEIHDVDVITNVPVNGDVLGYDGTLWVNKTIAEWLGYTPADDALVVHKAGTETITGSKTFTSPVIINKATANTDAILLNVGGNQQGRLTLNNDGGFDLFTSTDFSGYGINFDADDSNGILFYADDPNMAKFIVGQNYNISQQDLYSTKFIKIGGTADQYLKADGSVSTAMNSRIEVNFIATSGQTTFATTYEVGQVEVYYNGSKLYPDEFVATNGTTIVLVTPATLNAQISIVKFVSSFNTTSIRTETVFTTTAGQTTFSVNYAIGQVDVFYNGSKLSPAEFTATNGTSVVLGFACAAGESIVIDSFVNQVSGAVGTANKVAKFTGTASLGDSQIDDNGTNVSIGYTTNPNAYKLDVNGTGRIQGQLTLGNFDGQALKLQAATSTGSSYLRFFNSVGTARGYLGLFWSGSADYMLYDAGALESQFSSSSKFTFLGSNVLIGTSTDAGQKLQVAGTGKFVGSGFGSNGLEANGANGGNGIYAVAGGSAGSAVYGYTNDASSFGGTFQNTTSGIALRVLGNSTITGNVGIGTASPGAKLQVDGQDIYLTGNTDNRIRFSNYGFTGNSMGAAVGYIYGVANTQEQGNLAFYTNPNFNSTGSLTERMRITSGGNICVGTTTFSALNKGIVINDSANCGIALRNNDVNKGYFYNNGNNVWVETTGGTLYAVAGSNGVYLANGAVAWLSNSDENLKTDLVPIEDAINKVCSLRSVIGRYKTDDIDKRRPFLIAQDVEKVLPEAVSKDVETGNLGVSYSEMIPLLVAAIKEQQAQIKELQDELVLLKNK